MPTDEYLNQSPIVALARILDSKALEVVTHAASDETDHNGVIESVPARELGVWIAHNVRHLSSDIRSKYATAAELVLLSGSDDADLYAADLLEAFFDTVPGRNMTDLAETGLFGPLAMTYLSNL